MALFLETNADHISLCKISNLHWFTSIHQQKELPNVESATCS